MLYRQLVSIMAILFIFCLMTVISFAGKGETGGEINSLSITADNATNDLSADALNQESETINKSTVRAGEQINWQVISSGSSMGNSANFILSGTAGQTATGAGASENYSISHGFWQETDDGPCDCTPGDANGNLTINILDITYLINYLYKGGPSPVPYAVCSGDPNANCAVNILDITYLINYLYKGGPLPLDCETWSGNCGGL